MSHVYSYPFSGCCADAAGADEIRDLTNQEDDWDKDGPDAVAFEKESWETSPPYRPVQSEENWEEEISASNASVPYSKYWISIASVV